MNMRKTLGIGIGIGCALSAIGLLYLGSNLLPYEGLTLRPGLMLLSSIALIILAAKFVSESEVATYIPMPPAAPKMNVGIPFGSKANKTKKPAKKAKKKKGKK